MANRHFRICYSNPRWLSYLCCVPSPTPTTQHDRYSSPSHIFTIKSDSKYTMMLPWHTTAPAELSTSFLIHIGKVFLFIFFAISLATSQPKHVLDDPISAHSPHCIALQAITGMGSIIPTIGDSPAGPALRTNHYTVCPWPDLQPSFIRRMTSI